MLNRHILLVKLINLANAIDNDLLFFKENVAYGDR